MLTIGMIGGMSYESTITYYQAINDKVKETLGGLHSAKIFMYSVNFAEIEHYQATAQWDKSGAILAEAAQKLEQAGADFIVICTNTMHKVVPQIEQHIKIPILHIADATADVLVAQDIKSVALLGTKYTMTQDFYKERLIKRGLEVIIPNEQDIEIVNNVIYNELCLGQINDESRQEYQRIIALLKEQGAQGVILGCTEIGLLIKQKDSVLPVFDTTLIHANQAAFLACRAR